MILPINTLWVDRTENVIAETNNRDLRFVVSKLWLKIPNTFFLYFLRLLDAYDEDYYKKRKEPDIRHVALKAYLIY